MTEIVLPPSLLNLPAPWNQLDTDPRDNLESSDASRAVALEVIDRCLEGIGQLPNVDPNEAFPEWITIAWGLWSGVFASEFGSFDGVRPEPIVEYFAKQDPNLNDEFVQRYLRAWLREQAMRRVTLAEQWVDEYLRDSRDASVVRALRAILQKRWRVDALRADSIMYTVWRRDPEGSRAVLREIAESPDAPKNLTEHARELLSR